MAGLGPWMPIDAPGQQRDGRLVANGIQGTTLAGNERPRTAEVVAHQDVAWLNEFQRRHTRNPEHIKPSSLSTRELVDRLKRIRAILTEAESLSAQNTNRLDSVAAEVALLEQEANSMMDTFSPSEIMLVKAKLRVRDKRKRWRLRHNYTIQERLAKKKATAVAVAAKIDEWQAHRRALDAARRLDHKMSRDAAQRKRDAEYEEKKKNEMGVLVSKLQELRTLRVEKLRKQGHFFPEEDAAFFEHVRALEARIVAQAALDDQTLDNNSHPKDLSIELSNTPQQQPASQLDMGPFDSYYLQATRSLDTLVSVRRQWDAYLVPQGRGTRIPGHWVEPAPPSSAEWASALKS